MNDPEPREDLVGNRLTVVPSVAIYAVKRGDTSARGRLGVTVSAITCRPSETDTEPSLGTWSASGSRLEVQIDGSDRGPRSGVASDYNARTIGIGRSKMLVSPAGLLGVTEGRSSWGDTGEKAGRLLVWRWNLGDIDQIEIGRLKSMMKLRDVELSIRCRDPKATLHYTGLGPDAHVFSAYDDTAKSAKSEGSHLLGFAQALASVVTRHRGCSVDHAAAGTKERTDTFTFR